MKIMLLFALATLLSAAPLAPVASDSIDQKIQTLRVEFDKYVGSLPKSSDQRARYGNDAGAAVQAMLSRMGSDIKLGNYESADQQLRQLGQLIPTPTAARLLGELIADQQAARDQRENAWVENIDALVTRAGLQILGAKNEKDLDGLLEESSNLRVAPNNRGGQNDRLQRAAQKVESLSYFVRRWQDYLAQLNAGNSNAARQVLQELSNDNSSRYPIIPRSELLARLTVAPAHQEALAPAKPQSYLFEAATLEELPAALERLRRHYSGNNIPADDANVIQVFSVLVNAVAATETGNLQPAFQLFSQNTFNSISLPERTNFLRFTLMRSLMLRVLPRFLDVKTELAPKADENPSEYCLRIARTGRESGDWLLVARALEGYERITFPGGQPPAWLSSNRQALTAYLTGLNQERMEDFGNAANSYMLTVTNQGTFLPTEDIAARLIHARKEVDARRAAEQQRQLEAVRRQQQQNPSPH